MKNLLSRKGFKILTIALVALIVTGGAMGVYYAASKSDDKSGDDITKLKDTIEDAVHIDKSMDGPGKEETVFAIGDANGNIKNLIVSEWLKNPEAKDTLDDYTELSDIKNTNGDETFTSSGGNKYTWNAKGKDIHYRGAIKKELPVKVSMQYLLNGMEITPEELAGKSGQVTIRFNYTNTQKTSADISGAKEDIYTPFVMISGVMLDSDRFSNVTVSSGSVINDGSRNIVVGLAMPGMKESLGITDEDIDFPNYVEIKADTTNFSLSATLTVAMTGLLNNVQIDSGNAVDELKSSLNDLEDAAIKLIDGSSDLYSGSSDLLSGAGDLKSGAGGTLKRREGSKERRGAGERRRGRFKGRPWHAFQKQRFAQRRGQRDRGRGVRYRHHAASGKAGFQRIDDTGAGRCHRAHPYQLRFCVQQSVQGRYGQTGGRGSQGCVPRLPR